MVNTNYIRFNERRNLSGLLNITFAFVKQEFKPLFKSILILVLPLLILLGIITGVFQAENMSLFISQEFTLDFNAEYFQNAILQYGLIILVYFISISVINAVILGYLVEYINNGPQVPFDNVVAQLKIHLGRLMWFNIIFFIITIIATFFFVIPGIYFYIAFTLSPVILVIEDSTLANSFKRSLYFLKGYWWQTLGYILVIGLIYIFISFIFSIPSFVFTTIQATDIINASPDSPLMLIMSVFVSILSTLSYLVFSIIAIFLTFYYYSQYELKEAGNITKNSENVS